MLFDQNLNKETWNRFVLDSNGSFLQSFEWGEFQESMGRRAIRLEKKNWQVQFIEMPLPLGKKYWYCPRGPIISGQIASTICQEIVEEAKKIADKNVIFFRVCPAWPDTLELAAKLEIIGLKKLRYDIEPSQTQILDITKSEQKLLAQMHPKWRYNVGLAQKKKLRIKIIDGTSEDFNKYFESFWRLMQQTAKRQKIKLHQKDYYRKQLAANNKQSTINNNQYSCKLFIAENHDKVIAANIVVFFWGKATYLHGGSDNEFRNLMAPHLLQWWQIKMAKKLGCTEYDFWGIDEARWPGVTRFKLGFGGEPVKYIGTWDYPIDRKWYLLYKGVQRFRR